MSKKAIIEARALLNTKDFGVLSTLSVKLGGFPFGSVVPYCLDEAGRPVIYISTIAQHTKNILADNRCSITILAEADDVQANGRLCISGHMELLPADKTDTVERYYRSFPKSRAYSGTHDFSFYRLEPVSVRYIGGFGAIHWLEPHDFLIHNPFNGASEVRVVEHMNEDHLHNLKAYCSYFKGLTIAETDQVRMTGIDSQGFDIYINDKKVRFQFEQPVLDAGEARAALVAMAKAAR